MIAITSTRALMEELNKTINGNLANGQIIVDETKFSKTDVKRLLLGMSAGKEDEIQMTTREMGTEIALGFTNGRMVMKYKTTYDLHAVNDGEYLAVQEVTETPAVDDAPASDDAARGFTVVDDVENPFDQPAGKTGEPDNVEVVEPEHLYEEHEIGDDDEEPDGASESAEPEYTPAEAVASEEEPTSEAKETPDEEDAPEEETADKAPKAEEAPVEEPAPAEPDPEPEADAEEADAPEAPAEPADTAKEPAPAPETIEVDCGELNYAEAKQKLMKATDGKPFGTIVKVKVKSVPKSGNCIASWSWVLGGKDYNVKKTAIREEDGFIYGEYVIEKPTAVATREEKPKPLCEKSQEHKLPPIAKVPETNFTAEDVAAKLDQETQLFRVCGSADAKWVIEHLKELCKDDHDLAQYIMKANKNFEEAFKYVSRLAKNRECGTVINADHGYCIDLSKEDSVQYFIEYYMLDEDEVKRLKDEEEAAKKAKADAAKKEAAAAKKGGKGKNKKAQADAPKPAAPTFDEIDKAKETVPAEPEKAPEAVVEAVAEAEPAPAAETKPEPIKDEKPAEAPAPKEPIKLPERKTAKPALSSLGDQVSIFDLLA